MNAMMMLRAVVLGMLSLLVASPVLAVSELSFYPHYDDILLTPFETGEYQLVDLENPTNRALISVELLENVEFNWQGNYEVSVLEFYDSPVEKDSIVGRGGIYSNGNGTYLLFMYGIKMIFGDADPDDYSYLLVRPSKKNRERWEVLDTTQAAITEYARMLELPEEDVQADKNNLLISNDGWWNRKFLDLLVRKHGNSMPVAGYIELVVE